MHIAIMLRNTLTNNNLLDFCNLFFIDKYRKRSIIELVELTVSIDKYMLEWSVLINYVACTSGRGYANFKNIIVQFMYARF